MDLAAGDAPTRDEGAAVPSPVDPLAVDSRVHYLGEAELPAAGTLTGSFGAWRSAGPAPWSYRLDAQGLEAGFNGAWVHAWPLGASCVNGVCVPPEGVAYPSAGVQARAEAGKAAFEAEHAFTGVREVPMVTGSGDLMLWGYADVDLEALYGWPWEDIVSPDGGLPGTSTAHTLCFEARAPLPCRTTHG